MRGPDGFTDYAASAAPWNAACAKVEAIYLRWLRIVRASEPSARLLILTGNRPYPMSRPTVNVSIVDITAIEDNEGNAETSMVPLRRGGRVLLVETESLGTWLERRTKPPTVEGPVASLYATYFAGAVE